jgi:hypothetical protein
LAAEVSARLVDREEVQSPNELVANSIIGVASLSVILVVAMPPRPVGHERVFGKQQEDTSMKRFLISALSVFWGAVSSGAAEFQAPVRLKAGDVAIRVENPGYAAPCWADIDGDNKKDLLVGQFRQGKIRVYKNLGNGKFAEGVWLLADGKVAEVPGVW